MTASTPDGAFTPVPALIAAHAAQRPRDIAFHAEGRPLDWATLHRHVTLVGGALQRCGVRPGDRVALLGAASPAWVECFFGILAARGCVVPLPASASVATLQALLADCGASLLLLDPDSGDEVAAMAGRLAAAGRLQVVPISLDDAGDSPFGRWRSTGAGAGPLPVGDAEDPFNIIYSSGTTGLPKGIVHLHGMRQRQACRRGFFSPQARTLLSTPTSSNTTIMPMLGTLAAGGTCLLMRRFDAGRFLALAQSQRATHTMLVPVQYRRILAHPDFDRTDLGSLELSQTTGAPMDATLKQEILRRWPGRLLEVYGLTEGGVSFFLDARAHPDKLGTVGRAGHGTVAFLVDEAGRRLPADAAGATGEVVGRSPFMMAGYHNRPDADAQIRWLDEQGVVHHRSGDIGRLDADGFLTLLDRARDMIISGGHNVHAADLEAVLARHEDVADAAVIGVPSEQWGETPLALVVLRPGARADAAAVRDWVNARVGRTERLSAVELRPELPRSALGKLSKKDLRAPYWPASPQQEQP